jgi:hypothetical protein
MEPLARRRLLSDRVWWRHARTEGSARCRTRPRSAMRRPFSLSVMLASLRPCHCPSRCRSLSRPLALCACELAPVDQSGKQTRATMQRPCFLSSARMCVRRGGHGAQARMHTREESAACRHKPSSRQRKRVYMLAFTIADPQTH